MIEERRMRVIESIMKEEFTYEETLYAIGFARGLWMDDLDDEGCSFGAKKQ